MTGFRIRGLTCEIMQASPPRLSRLENRDHVAELIEAQLRELARDEGTELLVEICDDGRVGARLAAVSARGENLDIAIIRLANALLDDPPYNELLTHALSRVSGLLLNQNCPLPRG